MTYNIFVSSFEKPKRAKDAIIGILTNQWPLSARKIYRRVINTGLSVTYQAVYKSLLELVDEKVIKVSKKKEYEINMKWIDDIHRFADTIETNYYAKNKVYSLSGINDENTKDNVTVINFESLFDAEKYIYFLIKHILRKTRNDMLCFNISSEWRPIFYMRTEYNNYKKLIGLGHKIFMLSNIKTRIERLCSKFYKKIGIKYKTTKDVVDNIVFADYFIQMYIPDDLKIKIKKLLEKEDIINLIEALEGSSNIRMIITKDKQIADSMKQNISSKF